MPGFFYFYFSIPALRPCARDVCYLLRTCVSQNNFLTAFLFYESQLKIRVTLHGGQCYFKVKIRCQVVIQQAVFNLIFSSSLGLILFTYFIHFLINDICKKYQPRIKSTNAVIGFVYDSGISNCSDFSRTVRVSNLLENALDCNLSWT